ncbi:MAG: efflux RND transporter permease subunit [Acidobacteriota bacterium]
MIRLALRNPYLIVVAGLATVVLGIASYRRIPADLLPIFRTPAVQIVTFYPGMPPEVMERDIMSRLERWTGQSVGIEHQEAKAMLGVSVVKDFFREGISLDTAMSQVTSYAVSDMFYLPPGTIPPMVMPFDPTASVPLCLVSVSSPTMDEKELYDIAYFELRNRLQSIRGVIAPAVYGGKLRRILAYVDRDKLEARGLSPMDVVQALKRQSVYIPAGNLKAGNFDYQIFANSMPPQVEELNDLPIAVRNGAPVLVRDVANVRDSSQIQTNVVRINGRRQVYIPIYRQPGANTIEIVNSIRRNLERILQRLREMDPKAGDLALEVVLDQSVYVRGSLRALQIEGLLGAAFAGLVVLLFLRRLRSTAVVLICLPLAVLASVTGLYFSSATLNAMTLGGLALVVGILIDQSIVVVEAIVRHVEQGEPPFDAALTGTREVAVPALIATLTFCVVFFPVTFLSGMAKYLFGPVAAAATLAMGASYLFAITLVPAFCARLLGPARGEAGAAAWTERLARSYARLVRRVLRLRRPLLAGVGALFLLSVALLGLTGSELFPQVDAGQFRIYIRLPSGTRIERTEATLADVERVLIDEIGQPDPEYPRIERHPDSNLRMLITNIGVLMDWPAAYTPNTGPMDAFVLAQLKEKRGLPGAFDYVDRLRGLLRERFPGVEFSFDTGGMLTAALNFGEPAPIHVQVSGSNLGTSHRIASIVAREIASVPGATDVRIAQRMDYPIIDLEIDRVKAAFAGVDVDDIMKNMVTATNSSIGFDPAFWIDERNGNHYFIGAQYAEEDLESLQTLLDVPITGDDGAAPVLLGTLVRMTRKVGPAVINHRNITRVIDVYAAALPGHDIGSVVSRIERRLDASAELLPAPRRSDRGKYYEVAGPQFVGKGYGYILTGEVATMRESVRQFLEGFLLAVILVYLVLVVQFRSFLEPLVVLLAVPLGLIGVGLTLYLTGTHLSIMAAMGIIMMTGLVVAYSILLVDFANRRMGEGASAEDAVCDAGRVRLRPILMTSLTTILALLPMAIGGRGAEANAPLARAIIGGALGAATLTLFVVPCLYLIFKTSRRAATAAPILVLLLVGPAFGLPAGALAAGDEGEPRGEPPLVEIVRPSAAGPEEVVLPGSFEPFERALLHAKVTGYLARMSVDIGDRVGRHAPLAELQVPEMEAELGRAEADLASATAEHHRAQAAAELTEITYRRLSELKASEPQAVTQQDVDVAAAEVEVARSRVDIAAAEIEVRRAKLSHLRALMSYAVIRAPFDGVVVRRFVDPGALIVAGAEGGDPVLEVANPDRLRLVLSIPEAVVPRVRVGLRAEVAVDALPGRTFSGEISRLAGVLADDTRSMRAEIDIDAREGLLRPGMYASVRLRLEGDETALTLPASALHHEARRPYVWTVRDGVVHRTEVRIVRDDGMTVTIGAGLDGGTPVVLNAPPGLRDGQVVRVREPGGEP